MGTVFANSLQDFVKSSPTCCSLASRNCQTLLFQNKWMTRTLRFDVTHKITRYKCYLTQKKSGSACLGIKFNVETKIFVVLSCG